MHASAAEEAFADLVRDRFEGAAVVRVEDG
jgi:hypothetical protein